MSKILAFSILGLMLLTSPLASSIPFSTVGGIDTFIYSTTLSNSGDATELNWVKNQLGDPLLTLDEKYNSTGSDWSLLDGETDVYATAFVGTPSYFLLKFGIGGTSYDSHYLFENIDNLSYGVIDFSDLGIELTGNFSIDRISHNDEFSTGTGIPEPLSLTLLALALLSFRMLQKNNLLSKVKK